MGCVSASEVVVNKIIDNNIYVWFLGGGPGSPKQQVIEFLTQKYKFKYISVIELVRFQENAGSPETVQVRKAIEDKVEFSSNLMKVVVLYGPRKYLIDSFPRNMADVAQFQSACKKHPELKFQALLHLDISEEQMKESGMKTLGEVKKNASKEEIQKQVRVIIDNYRDKNKPVLDYYSSKQQIIRVAFRNSDAQLTLNQVESLLSSRKINAVNFCPFIFMNGNEEDELYSFGVRLSRSYDLMFWSMRDLKDEYRSKAEINRYLSDTKQEDISSEFLVELIFKKLDRYNYRGRYLINGFPRNQRDVAALRGRFKDQVTIIAFAGYLHTPSTQKEKESLQAIHKFFEQEQAHSVLINSSEQSYTQLFKHVGKITEQATKGNARVILFPMFKEEGVEHLKKLEEWCEVVDFQGLILKQISEQRIASDFLTSALALKKPIPSHIAIETFSKVVAAQQTKVLVFKGFPQNVQQLKIVYSHNQGVKLICGMFIQQSRIRRNHKDLSESEILSYQKLCKYLQGGSDKILKINEKTTYQQLKSCVDSL